MQLLKEIKDGEYPVDKSKLKTREAVRAVLLDENNLVPLLFVSKYNYHKLPGGGVEEGEDYEATLRRECLEEVGCEIEIEGEVGKIIEFRSKWNFQQTSYCHYGKVILKGNPSFTDKEIDNGFQVVWYSLEEAISKMEKDKPEGYEAPFIHQRDLELLKRFRDIKKT